MLPVAGEEKDGTGKTEGMHKQLSIFGEFQGWKQSHRYCYLYYVSKMFSDHATVRSENEK